MGCPGGHLFSSCWEGVLALLAFASLSQELGPVTAQVFAAYGHTGQTAGPSALLSAGFLLCLGTVGATVLGTPGILSPPCRSRDCPPLLHLNTLRLVCPPL